MANAFLLRQGDKLVPRNKPKGWGPLVPLTIVSVSGGFVSLSNLKSYKITNLKYDYLYVNSSGKTEELLDNNGYTKCPKCGRSVIANNVIKTYECSFSMCGWKVRR